MGRKEIIPLGSSLRECSLCGTAIAGTLQKLLGAGRAGRMQVLSCQPLKQKLIVTEAGFTFAHLISALGVPVKNFVKIDQSPRKISALAKHILTKKSVVKNVPTSSTCMIVLSELEQEDFPQVSYFPMCSLLLELTLFSCWLM